MLVLTGNSLGERQKELNIKVNEAVSENTDFENVKNQIENADVDRLFKIDLASKYKNVDYILDILKCGDSLYISRALKCVWLYNDEYSNVINTDYLHNNVFPLMSMKMKKKLLLTIAMYVKNERAVLFYTYCMNAKLQNIASKFLISAPESFKLEIIDDKQTQDILQNIGKDYITQFVGNSFTLAETYLKITSEFRSFHVLHQLRYLYSVSDVNYLELIEKYYTTDQTAYSRLGLRISKDIMTKHKERVRKNPLKYLSLLNKTMLVKYSTSDDAKLYTEALLPPKCSIFWNINFYETHKHIIDLIPFEERLQFLKNVFNNKFPGEEFEMSIKFYNSEYYNLMTIEEREAWALRHLESGMELLGSGRNFMWYKFVNFDKAIDAIKKIIMITNNPDSRAEIVTVLVGSAKNDQDLEKLFHYYYKRHVNEKQHIKERFIDSVLQDHNVYEFGESCWTAFHKLFYSLEIYSEGYNGYKTEYIMIALIYNIIHGQDIPKALTKFIDSGIYYYLFKTQTDKLSKENEEIVYKYMLKFYLDSFTSLVSASNTGENVNDEKERIRKYINYVLELLSQYEKQKEDIPDIIKKYMMLDWEEFKNHKLFWQEEPKFTQDILLRLLKKDTTLFESELSQFEEKLKQIYGTFKLTKLCRKLKVYFSHDVAKVFTDLLMKSLLECNELPRSGIHTAVYGIFELADEKIKIEFMEKHVPTEPKIDHSTIDRRLLYTQEAICRLACYSRPPIPLSIMLSYIKGDYVHYCLPMFNSYLAKLPLPLCIEFTKSLIDAPLSIQKHGIRLAFQCLSSDDLRKLIFDVWIKTKNVSLRFVIYKALYNKILKENEFVQNILFQVLNKLTLDLHEDDCDDLFSLVTSNDLPADLLADYLETVWDMINKPTQKQAHLERRTQVINSIINKMELLRKEFLGKIVSDHLETALDEELISERVSNNALNEAKWQLTAKYLVYYTGKEDSEDKLALAQSIVHKCIQMWNKVKEGVYVARQLCYKFIDDVDNVCYNYGVDSTAQGNAIFEQILKDFVDRLPLYEIYETVWDLRLSIIGRKIFIERKPQITLGDNADKLKLLEEGIKDFGKQFANLLNEFIEKRIYYAYFFENINSMFEKRTTQLFYSLKPFELSDFHIGDAKVLICTQLLVLDMIQTYMFALKTLPIEYSLRYFDIYKNSIGKIKQYENSEIQCYMYKKFGDLKYREYL